MVKNSVLMLAHYLAPLTDVLQRGKLTDRGKVTGETFYLTPEELEATFKVKKICEDHLKLEAHVANDRYKLFVDASGVAIGALLCQKRQYNTLRAVQLFSQKLKGTQRHWTVAEKEAFALAQAVHKYC